MISLIIIDDDALFCSGVEQAFNQKIKILGEASSGLQGLKLLRKIKPDMILLNAQLPDMSGERFCRMAHRKWPRIRFIFTFSTIHWPTLSRLIESPAQGFLTKEACYRSLEAIKTIHTGKTYLQPDLALQLFRYRADTAACRLEMLSTREYEVLVLLAREKNYEDIAEMIHLNIRSIYNLKVSAFKKLGFSNQMSWHSHVLMGLPSNGQS